MDRARVVRLNYALIEVVRALDGDQQVSIKQRDTEADLAKAEPAVAAAMAALDTLNKKVSAR